ncbi:MULTISPECIES: transposase [Brenneria]|uniref:transposase n=1 Tax=Brenneria TaxID=71655 RepID=UPI00022F8067|nr:MULTISPECIES: transposase [Brenneria]EHD23057.1 transposase YhgA family protein [Brenneria sp. EniD312]
MTPFINGLEVTPTQKRALLLYIVKSGNTSRPADFIKTVAEPQSADREELMTIAQQLKQIGFEEGMKTSARNIARELLQSGMESDRVQRITKLSADEMRQLISSGDE